MSKFNMAAIKEVAGTSFGSEGGIISGIREVISQVSAWSPTKEQALISVVAIGGIVVAYAIKNNYDFEYDHKSMKLSFCKSENMAA